MRLAAHGYGVLFGGLLLLGACADDSAGTGTTGESSGAESESASASSEASESESESEEGGESEAETSGESGESGEACPAPLSECESTCVNLDSDNLNCGTCGQACDPGFACDGQGACAATCVAGQVLCDASCVDPNTDELHCGASADCTGANAGIACAAGELCDGAGSCALACQAGLIDCGGLCVDPDSDERFCGASGDCMDPNAGTACAAGELCDGAGSCAISCQAGLIDCGGECVDPDIDERYCGASADCAGANAGTVCASGELCDGAGSCALSCQVGLIDCGGQCVDPLSDEAFCGASSDCTGADAGLACAGGEVCDGAGACATSCVVGLLQCGDDCIDPMSDVDFCGASGGCAGVELGAQCDGDETCFQGACREVREWRDGGLLPGITQSFIMRRNASGQVFVIGGQPSGETLSWEPSTGTWTNLGPHPAEAAGGRITGAYLADDGSLYAAWTGVADRRVTFARMVAGTGWSEVNSVLPHDGGSYGSYNTASRIAADGQGGAFGLYAYVFEDLGQPAGFVSEVRRVHNTGTGGWSAPEMVAEPPPAQTERLVGVPRAAFDASGAGVLTYTAFMSSPNRTVPFARLYDPTTGWADPVSLELLPLGSVLGTSSMRVFALDSGHRIVFVAQQPGTTGVGAETAATDWTGVASKDLWAHVYDPQTGWATPLQLTSDPLDFSGMDVEPVSSDSLRVAWLESSDVSLHVRDFSATAGWGVDETLELGGFGGGSTGADLGIYTDATSGDSMVSTVTGSVFRSEQGAAFESEGDIMGTSVSNPDNIDMVVFDNGNAIVLHGNSVETRAFFYD